MDNPNLLTSLLSTPSFAFCRMTRFSDPAVVEHDFSAYSCSWILVGLTNLLLNSGAQVLLAHHKWPLHVGVIRCVTTPFPLSTLTPTSTGRWEYLTTLDFEFDVIRRRRPYRWTICVGIVRRLFSLASILLTKDSGLIFVDLLPYTCMDTPDRDYQLRCF